MQPPSGNPNADDVRPDPGHEKGADGAATERDSAIVTDIAAEERYVLAAGLASFGAVVAYSEPPPLLCSPGRLRLAMPFVEVGHNSTCTRAHQIL